MLCIFDDREKLSRAAAGHIVQVGRQCVEDRGRFDLVLSGGSTPRRVYEMLAGTAQGHPTLWENTHFYWGDERCVPPEHPDSNYRLAKLSLLEPLGIPPGQVHRIAAEAPNPESAALAYETEFPAEPDLLLLGCGEDGHIASLFPGSPALGESKRSFVAVEGPKEPRRRITITPPAIAAARKVLVLLAGTNKARAVLRVFSREGSMEETPARLVRGARWFMDKDASARIVRSGAGVQDRVEIGKAV
jgi:6-phosphogluconolactonase